MGRHALILAGYGLLTSVLYALRRARGYLAHWIGMTALRTGGSRRLAGANTVLSAVVLGLAFWADFAFASVGSRVLPAIAALTQLASLCLIARAAWGPPDPSPAESTQVRPIGQLEVIQAALMIGVAALRCSWLGAARSHCRPLGGFNMLRWRPPC